MKQTDKPSVAEQQKIDDMNEAIAIFMGYYKQAGKFYASNGGAGGWFKNAQYHSDWNWIHRAWDKLYLEFRIMGTEKAQEFSDRFCLRMQLSLFTGNITTAHRPPYTF